MSHLPHGAAICVTLLYSVLWTHGSCNICHFVGPRLIWHLPQLHCGPTSYMVSHCESRSLVTLATTTLRAHKLYGVTLWIQESCDTCHNYTAGPQVIWCHIVNPGVLWHLPQCLCNLAAASCGWFYCSQIQHKNVLEHPDAFCTRQSLSKGSICFSEVLFSMHSFIAVYNSKVHCLLFILGYWLEFTTAKYIVYCLYWGTG